MIDEASTSNLSVSSLQAAIEYFQHLLEEPSLPLQPSIILVTKAQKDRLDAHYGEGNYQEAQVQYHQITGKWLEDDDAQTVMDRLFEGLFI